MKNYPRGSEWRRWDLHVHTPASGLNNQFPKTNDGGPDWEQYVTALETINDVAALGVTEYFSVEGYTKLRELQASGRLSNFDLLLPNVELRLSHIMGQKRLNMHVIFSDELSVETIEDDFLRELKFTCQASPDDKDDRWSVKRSALEDLGKRLKSEHSQFQDRSDYEIGCMNAVVNMEDVVTTLSNNKFRKKYVVVLAEENTSMAS